MMFETSDKNIATLRVANFEQSLDSRIKQIEQQEVELKRQEGELLASKEKVFAKWQEYLEKAELLDAREREVARLWEQAQIKEADLEQRQRQMEEKEVSLGKRRK